MPTPNSTNKISIAKSTKCWSFIVLELPAQILGVTTPKLATEKGKPSLSSHNSKRLTQRGEP